MHRFRLFVVETSVELVAWVKLVVSALSHNFTRIENKDAVGVLNRAKAVRNNQHRAAFG